jgi:PBP1b-binding outer membrane lipoprotein LpoB
MKKIKNLIGPAVCLGLGMMVLSACEKSTKFTPSTADGRLAVGQEMNFKSLIVAPDAPIDTRQTTPASTSLDKGNGLGIAYYYDYRKIELYPLPKPDPDPEPWSLKLNP